MRSFDLVKMDANNDEYFTRHTLEGEIVYCDQRYLFFLKAAVSRLIKIKL